MKRTIKEIIKNYLLNVRDNITPKTSMGIKSIKEHFTYEENVTKNKLWYRGDVYELAQFWNLQTSSIDKNTFWNKINTSKKMPARHYPLPRVMVDIIKKICILSYNRIEIDNENALKKWEEIANKNDFIKNVYDKAIKAALVTGDGAFAINIDSEFSPLPIIEVVDGENLKYEYKYGQIYIVTRLKEFAQDGKRFVLEEKHFLKQEVVQYKLYDQEGEEVPKNTLPQTAHLPEEIQTPGYNLIIPFRVYESEIYKGRGESLLDGADSAFDFLDETLSTWALAIRKNKALTAAPAKIGKDGEREDYNEFDTDIMILPTSKKVVNGSDRDSSLVNIEHINPTFDATIYETTIRAIIETALINKMSSVSIGMDTRTHADPNASFDREREKVTYHTALDIQEAFKDPLIQLVRNCLFVCRFLFQESYVLSNEEVQVINNEFASPSFEQILETTNAAVAAGNMSLFRSIQYQEEDFTDEQILEEIERIKQDKNIYSEADFFGLNDEQIKTNEEENEEEKEEQEKEE